MPKSIVNVAGFPIGGDRTYIIADIGSNHKQDLNLAKESIDAATEAGVNAVKFQSINLKGIYANPDQATAEFIRKLEFPEDWHEILSEYCAKKGILFFSSPTYMKAVDLLEKVDVPLYKLASAQIGTFPQIVERVAALGKPTIFSTGIATYDEIISAVRLFERVGNNKYIILHCNSIYPVPPNRVNLPLMDVYKAMFDCPVGFSDHTDGIHISLCAVSRGAKVIEKHFTLDKEFDTPDSTTFAADPQELSSLVKQIREVEQSLVRNAPRLEIESEEKMFKNSVLYRACLKRKIKAGEVITNSDVDYLRAIEGIDSREAFLKREFGRAKVDLSAGTILRREHLSNYYEI